MAVERHPRQPGRRVRAALPRHLPDPVAGLLHRVRRAGPRRGGAGQHGREHRGRCPGRPLGPAAGAALVAGGDRADAGRARVLQLGRRRAGAGHAVRLLQQRDPAGLLRDDGRHRAARRPGSRVLAALLGGQPRLRHRGDPRRPAGLVRLPHAVPPRRGDDRRLRRARLPAGPRVPPGDAGRPGRARPHAGLDVRRAARPGVPDLHAADVRVRGRLHAAHVDAAGADGRRRPEPVAVRRRDLPQRRPDRPRDGAAHPVAGAVPGSAGAGGERRSSSASGSARRRGRAPSRRTRRRWSCGPSAS